MFSWWDAALFLVVAGLALGVAYMPNPRHKAFCMSLPLPSTVGTMAVGYINASNVTGFTLLLLFFWQVWFTHCRLKWNIIISIISGAAVFCFLGVLIFPLLPKGEAGFWIGALWNLALAIPLFLLVPGRDEPKHKSPMPFFPKALAVTGVVLMLIFMKKYLGGFIVAFPMVGVIGAYESRYSLWGMARQIPLMMISVGVLNMIAYPLIPRIGLLPALLIGWLGYLALFFPMHRWLWKTPSPLPVKEKAPSAVAEIDQHD